MVRRPRPRRPRTDIRRAIARAREVTEMGLRRTGGGRPRGETPQEAWERMRSGGRGASNGVQATATRPQPVAAPPPPPPPEPAPRPTPPRAAPRPPAPPNREQEEASVSDLVKQLSEQTSTLV